MRLFIHIVTDDTRIVDPEGTDFRHLNDAIDEASQSARDLMAEELRAGRALPLSWCVQVASVDEVVLKTIRFFSLVYGPNTLTHSNATNNLPTHNALIERARETFSQARSSKVGVDQQFTRLRSQLKSLTQSVSSIKGK